jgi:hypothetical protein
MATIARVRHSHILSAAVALLLAAPGAFAESPETKVTTSLREAVKAGDFVAVTRWSSGKVKGQVAEATECSILLNVAGKTLTIQNEAIKTVRRYAPPKPDAGKAMLGAVEPCDRIECTPITLAVVGVAALVKGFQGLGRKSEVVYRGKRDQAARVLCSQDARSHASNQRASPGR